MIRSSYLYDNLHYELLDKKKNLLGKLMLTPLTQKERKLLLLIDKQTIEMHLRVKMKPCD